MKINDDGTNKVYFSSHLKRFKCWENIREALDSQSVQYGILPDTKDIWVRDFMPIQIQQNSFLDYIYNPDYLKNLNKYVTIDKSACYDFLGSHLQFLDVILDGGNFINCGDKILMTDKIFIENKHIDKRTLVDLIETMFSAEIVILPWDKAEPYGHADGMVRFVKPGHVLINHYKDYDEHLRSQLIKVLSNHFISISELAYGTYARNSSWAHLNFLRVGNKLFVPQLNIASDDMAINQIQDVYSDCYVVPVHIGGIVKKGGGLNCVSWNIKEYESPLFKSTYVHYAEKMHELLIQRKEMRTTVSELFGILIEERMDVVSPDIVHLPDMFTLTQAFWDCIKRHKMILRSEVFPNASDIGFPYNIPYNFCLVSENTK